MITLLARAAAYRSCPFVGWNLLLIVCETTAIALLLAGWHLCGGPRSARAQYAAAVAAFAIATLLGAVTPIALLTAPIRTSAAIQRMGVSLFAGLTALIPPTIILSSRSPFALLLPSADVLAGLGGLLWSVGVLVLAGRLWGGWIALQRLCHRTARADSVEVRRIATRLRRQFRLPRPVIVLQSHRIEAPVTLGWRRPTIILPAAATEQLSVKTLELLMAHEFAHIGRRDYVANLVQSGAEVLLFFSPAARWLSRKIREAREYCCDDLTVQECGDGEAYVRALTALASLGSRHREEPALGVAGPRLITRVRRLLQEDAMPRFAIGRLLLICGALGAVALTAVSVAGCAAGSASRSGVTRAPDTAKPPASDQFGSWIQFDTKGVEFGPWVRGFVAQVKPHWSVPSEAMSNKGHVVLTFNVHKDGSITDLTIAGPSSLDPFNKAALDALTASNPLPRLPPEYPADKAFFTVTFLYNERADQTSQAPLK